MSRSRRMPCAMESRVTFGAPMRLGGADYESLARQVEEAVRGLAFTPSPDTQTKQPQVSS